MAKQLLDRRALGLALSRLANAAALDDSRSNELTRSGARRIALTGPPGAGKSTLIGKLALHRVGGRRLGVLAVDPSSPKSGGAILGDRVRMDDLPGADELFIRSIGSRSATDGLADNLPSMLDVMDDFEFDEVIVETVGVGQAEYAVRTQVDTVVLVLLPDSGDVIQAMKAGIMEMADIFVVNKADLAGANRMATDIKRIAALARVGPSDWRAPVLLTSGSDGSSIEVLSDAIDSHAQWLTSSSRLKELAADRSRYRLHRAFERLAAKHIQSLSQKDLEAPISQQLSMLAEKINKGVN